MWVLLMLPRFGGAKHASGHNHRSRHRQVGVSGARHRRGRQCAHPPSAEAPLRLAFFQKLPPCLVGIEACATSHHWSRELKALGHNVRLMPPAYVKPYVKRQKNDAADAEAICEAVTRANMRFVETKTPEQQSCLMLHRTRQLFIRQQRPSLGSSCQWDAKGLNNCLRSSRMLKTSACLGLLAPVLPRSAPNCVGSRSRF